MLEIGIHHDHRAPARMSQPRAQRFLVAEIAGEREIADLRDWRPQRRGWRRACRRGAVIDEYDLVAAERLQDASSSVARHAARYCRPRYGPAAPPKYQGPVRSSLRSMPIHLRPLLDAARSTSARPQSLTGRGLPGTHAPPARTMGQPGVAYYDGCMDARTTTAGGGDSRAPSSNFALRKPGQTLAIVLGAHFVVWTLLPLLTSAQSRTRPRRRPGARQGMAARLLEASAAALVDGRSGLSPDRADRIRSMCSGRSR